jgi:hypothetical protein
VLPQLALSLTCIVGFAELSRRWIEAPALGLKRLFPYRGPVPPF